VRRIGHSAVEVEHEGGVAEGAGQYPNPGTLIGSYRGAAVRPRVVSEMQDPLDAPCVWNENPTMKRNLLRCLACVAASALALANAACDRTQAQTPAPSSAATTATTTPAPSSAAATTAPAPPARAASAFDHVYVYDIDWRTGGRALFLRGDGSGILRVATRLEDNVQPEKRYTLPPSTERAGAIRAILEAHGASSMKVDPTMAPGDQIAVVRVLPPTGPELSLRGPAGRNEPFRKMLLELEKALASISTAGISPSYDGKLDPYWTPPFASPNDVVTRHKLGRLKQGKLHEVATLAFDRRASATLTIDEPGEDAEAVQRAWSEVSSDDELSLKSEEEDATAHRLVGSKVRRGEKNYPAGVLNVLSARYGVFAVEQKR
jgi:hypothetical protein